MTLCALCYRDAVRFRLYTLDCEHTAHYACLLRHIPRTCPECQLPLSRADRQILIRAREDLARQRYLQPECSSEDEGYASF